MNDIVFDFDIGCPENGKSNYASFLQEDLDSQVDSRNFIFNEEINVEQTQRECFSDPQDLRNCSKDINVSKTLLTVPILI